ncbi:MAG TPA: hypothetical protein VK666_26945 [Chryseolinea sp.]|nr:hypothetical protein [Chryseolinea sp.]
MKLEPSPIQLRVFSILKFEFKTIPGTETLKAQDAFGKYDVDIDFAVNESKGIYFAYVKVAINNDMEPLQGYSIFAEGVARFKITDPEAKLKSDIPCINIAIQCLRNYIAMSTAEGYLGKYMLPTVNLGAMLNAKNEQVMTTRIQGKKVVRKKSTK